MAPINPEPIAIVGSGCRFPGGANSPSSLWKLLERPRDLSQEIPADRFSTKGFYHHDGARHGTTNVRHSYFLDEDVRLFDAAFFNISPNEAEAIDPQQRLLLETVYEALEAGGHTLEGLRGSDTSVYVGTMTVDYLDTLLRDHNTIPKYFATGINRAIISNRVSYFFDWHGPSMTIDTACSSSLIAVHQGVQSLRSGESQVSVACGTQMLLGYDMYIGESKLKMLSPNGKSRMWDENADGYARGEGTAAIVMKRLSDAIADGDHIECIIRETGVNQDGFSNGLTVPSSEAQAALIRQTYAKAGLDPKNRPNDRPQYFEAHGTGTQAGDPKEAAAIHEAFGQHIHAEYGDPLYVGSIKTIIGHLEGAAGLAGLLKASASLQKGVIPPNLSFDRLNPKIKPFYKGLKVATSQIPWPGVADGVPRRASVNSFGFGGTNAHAILEQHIPAQDPTSRDVQDPSAPITFAPFVFSTLTETSLVKLLERYSQFLKTDANRINGSDLAWTLHSRRSQLPTRATFSASSLQQLIAKIDSRLAAVKENASSGTTVGLRSSGKAASPRVLGVFTGQGAQWPAMGARLIRSSPFVRVKIQQLEESLATLPPDDRPTWSLFHEMVAGADTSRVAEAALSQPLCTAIQIVLIDLLQAAGITFSSVVGHSSGEIAAAYAAGFFSAHDAIRIVYYRGLYARLAGNEENGQKGAMLAAGVSWGSLAIAAYNSSASITLSGDVDAIKKFARLLKVDVAYHSHHMIPCGDSYINALHACGVRVNYERSSTCSWFSSVFPSANGTEPFEGLQDIYWRDNMANTVFDEKINVALEVGPHPALKGPATQNIADLRPTPLPYSGVLNHALGFMWSLMGTKAVDLLSFENTVTDEPRVPKLVLDLPSESRRSAKIRKRTEGPHELLGVLSPESTNRDMRWSNILKLQGIMVLPAAAYVAMAIEACRKVAGDKSVQLFELSDLSIPKAITFEAEDTSGVEILVTLTAIKHHQDENVTADFSIHAVPNVSTGSDHDLELVASAAVSILLGDPATGVLPCTSVSEDYNMSEVDPDRVYASFEKLGYGYTGPFRGLSSTKRRLNQASALVDTYSYSKDEATFYLVHPSMLDVAFQSSMLAYSSPGDERLWSLHVPTSIGSIRVNPEICTLLSTSGSRVPISTILTGHPESFSASIDIFGEYGEEGMIQVEDLTLKPFAPATEAEDRWMYSSTILDVAVPDASRVDMSLAQSSWDDSEVAVACSETEKATELIYEAIASHGEVVEKANEIFNTHDRDITFKSHSYDVIVASSTLHATVSLQTTLENIRQLLRPGGYLVLLEQTDNSPVQFTTLMSSLPRWPTETAAAWHSALRGAGFGGIDTIGPKVDDSSSIWPFSVMATQAVDDQIIFLRRPLSVSSSPVFIDNLVILGTGGLQSLRIAEEILDSLFRFCGKITILGTLPTEAESKALGPMCTFLNLVDLDSPIFKAMTNDKVEGLKRLFGAARHILWPYHAASLAFCRSLSNEATHVDIATLDVSEVDEHVPKVIAEQLLRQCALDEWDQEKLTWSKEPETFLHRGKLLLPRILPNLDQNARLNASRRVITKTVPVAISNFAVISEPDSLLPRLVEDTFPPEVKEGSQPIAVIVECSSLTALHAVPGSFLFIAIGKTDITAHPVVTASMANSRSIIPVASLPAADMDGAVDVPASVTQSLPAGGKILVHSLSQRAAERNVQTWYSCVTAADDEHRLDPSWIRISTHESQNSVRRKLLSVQPTHFLDLATYLHPGVHAAGKTPLNLDKVLPFDCERIDASGLSRHEATLSRSFDREMLLDWLQDAITGAKATISASYGTQEEHVQEHCLQLNQISDTYAPRRITDVIRWPTDSEIRVEVRPLDSQPLFSEDKTYVLFGLSGQVGQSLCEWMVSNGAGCVCLTSRHPNVDQRWLESFRATKATVKIFAADITDRNSLENTVKTIRESCPPIAGVANGANVLSDAPFDGMSTDMMLQALGPKIDGSYNLDQVFYNDNLEFFVLFSSISCVIGTAGQSNYVAANGYLNGLAKQRRRRGLAASAFDIGLIIGIGLAQKAGRSVVDSLQKYGITHIANPKDRDAAGMPTAAMTSGLRTITTEESDIVWYNNPIFSHLVIDTPGADGGRDKSSAKATIKDEIAGAANVEAALTALKESFSARLQVILQSDDQDIAYDTPLVELGIDSLVAVEVRSWFLKALNVDVPVLKLVGGSSLAEICEMVMKKLPEDLIPRNKAGDAPASTATPKPAISAQSQSSINSTLMNEKTSSAQSDSENATSGLRTPSPVDTPPSTITRQASLQSLRYPHENKMEDKAFIKREPISMGQSRFWFLRLLVDDPTTFNVTLSFRMSGDIRVSDLERAVRVVTARHESLRTCFIGDEHEEDQASQCVLADSPVKLEHKTISSAEEVAAEYSKLRSHVFDLANGPLLRMILLTSPTSHYLLNGELLYELEYWRKIFPTDEQLPVFPLLPMARSSSRTSLTNYAVHQVSTQLEPEWAMRIKSVAKAKRSTPFHFYLAAFKTMLFSFTDAQDLVIGIADANRNDSDVMGSIGFFLNLLPLRFRRQSHQSFADTITQARTTAYGALENSRLPFDVLLKELNVARSSSYNPFFQAFFDYRQQTSDRQTWCDCQFDLEEMHPGRTAYDISLDVADLGSDVHVTLRVQKGLYDLTGARLLLETYTHFIRTFAQDVSLACDDIPRFSEEQLSRAVRIGQAPDLVSEWPATLPHRIDQVAESNTHKTALVDGLGNSLTYADMIRRIEAIAEALSKARVSPGSRVLVFQQAATDWICSMLAIMRIGGVYVPLDLRNPMPRLAAQSGHCQPSAVLVDDTTATDAPQLNVATVIDVSRVAYAPSTHISNSADPDAAAAILYSSGSTGTPKGIIIRHGGIRNEMEGYTKTYGLGAERVLQQSAFTFDFSIDQIFTGLVNGGTVYVVPWSKRGDPLSITEMMRIHSITYTKVTPSEYSMWMRYGGDNLAQASQWRFAFGGGEAMTKNVLRQFSDLGLEQLRLYNSYGPAEISIASHKGLIDYREESLQNRSEGLRTVSCGLSLPNYTTYILDENLKPLPAGMPGEVVIGGAGVSLGYLNDEKLTARVFVPNPYASPWYVANGWNRMHRTGDIGHLQEDGSLVFRNRVAGDTQVKLRGLRIDLGDIETNIISTAGDVLKEAVVTLRTGDPEFLVAHVVFSADQDIGDKEAFLEQLLGRLPLPQYMLPALAVSLDKLPLNNHNKIDRKAIKALALPQRTLPIGEVQGDTIDVTETMARLRQMWRQLIPNPKLTILPSTSFFLVGGNSLLVVRLQSRIRSVFNVAVRLVDLLGANTLAQMARTIEESPRVDPIDWEMETSPPTIPNFLRDAKVTETRGADGKTVLVTGATGNLAKHLISLLSADPRVRKIHYIAIRDKPRQDKPFFEPKVVSHIGDLSLPLLGLGFGEFRSLAEQADVILHLGAARSFWDNYSMLCPTNVHSTRDLVKLAGPRRIPIHFISTSGVLPRDEVGATTAASSAVAHEPPVDGSSVQTQPEHSKEQALDEFVRCAKLAGAVPDPTGWEGRIDLIPAEPLARWLCESVLQSRPGSSGSNDSAVATSSTTQFFHYESPVTVEVDELMGHINRAQREGEQQLALLPILKWMGRIKAVGFRYVLASQEATVRSNAGKLTSRR
ncbi:lovastatin nonaketide synthase [Hypoxylon sp. FL1284]|nr:lovastatin nonaketide synthase [Hypoxylon sp. FL1284]